MLITLTGKPGMGKTLTLTSLAYKSFKSDNNPLKIWIKEKIFRKKHIYLVRQYSDFPIIFKHSKKNKQYLVTDGMHEPILVDHISSISCRIFDLILDNKFCPNAEFFFDEIQAKYDSMEYKDFPDSIAHYCQAHRHFGNNIYISSQSQSRIIKRLLVLSEEYWDIQSFKKIFGFAIVNIRKSWDMKANLENGIMNDNLVDVDYIRRIYRIKKVGNMYNSCYLSKLQEDSKSYSFNMFNTMELSKSQLLHSFFPSQEEREHLKNMRY